MTRFVLIIIFITGFINQQFVFGQIKLPRLVRDSMILQRDTKINIWGWAASGEKVNIRFNGKSYKTTTSKDGKWMIVLSPMKAGGPYTMDISGSNKITLKDILIGDVWICSGQSNMVHQMKLHAVRYADEIAGNFKMNTFKFARNAVEQGSFDGASDPRPGAEVHARRLTGVRAGPGDKRAMGRQGRPKARGSHVR